MTRLIKHEATGPYRLDVSKIEGDAAFLCQCGLSANKPFCDSSHRATRDEKPGKLYRYPDDDDQKPRREIQEP